MRLILFFLLLLHIVLAHGWTYKTVQNPLDLSKSVYLRKVKTGSLYQWYMITPNDAGYQVHPVTDVQDHGDHVHMESRLYGSLRLDVVDTPPGRDLLFLFDGQDPFGLCDGSP